MSFYSRLWREQSGFVISTELVMVATLMVIGLTVGMTMVRNQVVQELVDVGQAIGSLDQSYGYGGICKPGMAFTAGTCYRDVVDFCQAPNQEPGTEPGGICVRCEPRSELDGEESNPGVELWREFLHKSASHAARHGRLQIVREGLWESLHQQWAGLLCAEVVGPVSLRRVTATSTDTLRDEEQVMLSGRIAVWVDAARYDRFQEQFRSALAAVALRHGEWTTVADPRSGEISLPEGAMMDGCRCDGVAQFQADRAFHPGDWGTEAADLGKETVVLLNVRRNGPETTWAWFDIPRQENLLRVPVELRIDLLGTCDGILGTESVPLRLGCNACPPGLEVLDVSPCRDAEFRTLGKLGAKNPTLTEAAVAARRNAARHPEDMLVVISPYLVLSPGDDLPQSYAMRLLIPFQHRLTVRQSKDLKDVRCVANVVADR